MSYFNSEQLAHMRYLDALPDEATCWCGWAHIDECARGTGPCTIRDRAPIAPFTFADRRLVQCPDVHCRNYPDRPGEIIRVHNVACRRDHAVEGARNLADAYRPEGVRG